MPTRQPSLHILEDTLVTVLREVLPKKIVWNYYQVARDIVTKAKTKSIASRCIVASNKKLQEKTDKIKLAGRSDTGVFAQILLLTRRKMHHKGLRLIEPTMPEWVTLKETCKLATEFCHEFGLTIKEGYTAYLQIGLIKMKNFSFYKFKSMHGTICNYYECNQEIEQDKTPNRTTLLYELYIRKINQKLGWEHNDYKENPEKYVCFVRAKTLADKFKIKIPDYVDAMFFAFEWGDKEMIPDPLQLYGDKAIERVRKYCYEKNITIKDAPKIDFKKLKHG